MIIRYICWSAYSDQISPLIFNAALILSETHINLWNILSCFDGELQLGVGSGISRKIGNRPDRHIQGAITSRNFPAEAAATLGRAIAAIKINVGITVVGSPPRLRIVAIETNRLRWRQIGSFEAHSLSQVAIKAKIEYASLVLWEHSEIDSRWLLAIFPSGIGNSILGKHIAHSLIPSAAVFVGDRGERTKFTHKEGSITQARPVDSCDNLVSHSVGGDSLIGIILIVGFILGVTFKLARLGRHCVAIIGEWHGWDVLQWNAVPISPLVSEKERLVEMESID